MSLLKTAATIYGWYMDPVQFFRDVAGQEPVAAQKVILNYVRGSETRLLVCAASGVGKTRVLAVCALWYCAVLPFVRKKAVQVLLLSGSLEQAKVMYEFTREFINNSKEIENQTEERLKTETRFKNGSLLRALPCSERAYFGKHVDLLIIDEAALKDFPETLIDHAFSIVAPIKDAKLIMSSVPYNSNSRFVSLWEVAEESGWRKVSWQAIDCPFIDRSLVEEARKTLSKEQFDIRWKGEIVPMEDSLFRRESLKECISDNKPRKSLEPICFGLDWGFRHPTVIVVVQREGEGWNVLESRFWKQERIDKLYDDIVALYNRYKPMSIYADSSHIFENNKLVEMGLPVFAIHFRKEKEMMITNLVSLVEHAKVNIFEEEVALIAQMRDYKRKKKKNDDWVDALMLAVKEGIESRNLPFYYKIVSY